MSSTPEKIGPDDVIRTLLERQGAYNPVNVSRFVCIEQTAFTTQPKLLHFSEFMMTYGYNVALLGNAGSVSGHAVSLDKSARSLKREFNLVDDKLSLCRLQAEGFPVLFIGGENKYGLTPLMNLAPEDPFFAMGSEFWMGSMAKARSVINRPRNIETIAPNPDYL